MNLLMSQIGGFGGEDPKKAWCCLNGSNLHATEQTNQANNERRPPGRWISRRRVVRDQLGHHSGGLGCP
jgi:hypothetical protein